jgi:hypothetical protein
MIPFAPFVQQGWECPKCRRVYAPFVQACQTCGNLAVTIAPSTPVCTCGTSAAGVCPIHGGTICDLDRDWKY